MSKKSYTAGHKFDAEMRIRIDKNIYPNIDEMGVMDLVQAVLEGENVEGIKVEGFTVRDEDQKANISEYDFASAFIRSAERITEEEITLEPEQPKRKRTRKKGKKRN